MGARRARGGLTTGWSGEARGTGGQIAAGTHLCVEGVVDSPTLQRAEIPQASGRKGQRLAYASLGRLSCLWGLGQTKPIHSPGLPGREAPPIRMGLVD